MVGLTDSMWDWVLLALASYGLLSAGMLFLSRVIRRRAVRKPQRINLMLLVRDQEEHIEGILRTAMAWMRTRWNPADHIGEMYVIDTGSADGTLAILQRMSSDEPGIRLIQLSDVHQACTQGERPLMAIGEASLLVDLREAADYNRVLRALETVW